MGNIHKSRVGTGHDLKSFCQAVLAMDALISSFCEDFMLCLCLHKIVFFKI